MGRAGAFSANFDPDTLDEFRTFCSSRGEKYTKVLEQLALIYLQSKGEVLAGASGMPVGESEATSTGQTSSAAKEDIYMRLDHLEEANEYVEQTLNSVIKRMNTLEKNHSSEK